MASLEALETVLLLNPHKESQKQLENRRISGEVEQSTQVEGTDKIGLGEDLGPRGGPGEPVQKLRIAVTDMGGYWRVDVFEDDNFQTFDCKTPEQLGGALANAYSAIRNLGK